MTLQYADLCYVAKHHSFSHDLVSQMIFGLGIPSSLSSKPTHFDFMSLSWTQTRLLLSRMAKYAAVDNYQTKNPILERVFIFFPAIFSNLSVFAEHNVTNQISYCPIFSYRQLNICLMHWMAEHVRGTVRILTGC